MRLSSVITRGRIETGKRAPTNITGTPTYRDARTLLYGLRGANRSISHSAFVGRPSQRVIRPLRSRNSRRSPSGIDGVNLHLSLTYSVTHLVKEAQGPVLARRRGRGKRRRGKRRYGKPCSRSKEAPGSGATRDGAGVPQRRRLVHGTNQIVADTSDNDHGRNGPHDKKYGHVRLLLSPRENVSLLPLVPGTGCSGLI